jgi:hypothetical protein
MATDYFSYTYDVDVNEIYETFESDINTIFDKHVPTKEMYRKNYQLPYMNRELRKAIYNKKMFFGEIGFHGFPELSLFTATDRVHLSWK